MLVELNIYELYYLLESALKGGKEHTSVLRRFIDDIYDKLTDDERIFLWQNALHKCYCNCFIPSPDGTGLDKIFMARYNPENKWRVTYRAEMFFDKEKTVETFRVDGLYYLNSVTAVDKERIISVEKI